jgi:hypothetical protein
MKGAGNGPAKDWFQQNDIDQLPIEERYQIRAAHEYSVQLYHQVGQEVPVGFLTPDRCPVRLPVPPPRPVAIPPPQKSKFPVVFAIISVTVIVALWYFSS